MDSAIINRMHLELKELKNTWSDGLITNDEYVKKLFVTMAKYIEFVEDTHDMEDC